MLCVRKHTPCVVESILQQLKWMRNRVYVGEIDIHSRVVESILQQLKSMRSRVNVGGSTYTAVWPATSTPSPEDVCGVHVRDVKLSSQTRARNPEDVTPPSTTITPSTTTAVWSAMAGGESPNVVASVVPVWWVIIMDQTHARCNYQLHKRNSIIKRIHRQSDGFLKERSTRACCHRRAEHGRVDGPHFIGEVVCPTTRRCCPHIPVCVCVCVCVCVVVCVHVRGRYARSKCVHVIC